MAYDGIITYGITKELLSVLKLSKIDKIYQPSREVIIIQFYTSNGVLRLLSSCNAMSARLCLTKNKYDNPASPPNFCMLLRKHLIGGRVTDVRQLESERIIEIDVEAMSEMGFTVSKKLVFEIMGKHSNIILVDNISGKILDACKRVSIDVNKYRQILPGTLYKYPPKQDKLPFKGINITSDIGRDSDIILSKVSGISPAIAREIAGYDNPVSRLDQIISSVDTMSYKPRIYFDKDNPIEFHLTDLREYEGLDIRYFESLSECIEYFFFHKESTNLLKQKSAPLYKNVKKMLDKAYLKKKRLSEDIMAAERADKYRLFGELLTANIHMLNGKESSIELFNWYDNSNITIPLDPKLSPSLNAQNMFRKYNKAKTAKKEKAVQLNEVDNDISYLESTLLWINNAKSVDDLSVIYSELEDEGYLKKKGLHKNPSKNKKASYKPNPIKYHLSSGYEVLVGRNNRENDYLTTRLAKKTDLWLHVKDIPGSHVIVSIPKNINISDLESEVIYEAAAIAAYHSRAAGGENVPVDYVSVRHVKKPKNAKPGMVIFTSNKTVYVNPGLPHEASSIHL